jgi:uncharacterized protein YndB with AHSA1/START domain
MNNKTLTKMETGSKFEYVIYIRTSPQKLWEALTKPELTRQYWSGCTHDTDWKQGSSWKLMIPDGRVGESGEIEDIDEAKRLVLKWRNQFVPAMNADGDTRATIELEPVDDAVKLTLTHESERENSKMIDAVSTGWPIVLGSLKSLLETGESLKSTREWPKGM